VVPLVHLLPELACPLFPGQHSTPPPPAVGQEAGHAVRLLPVQLGSGWQGRGFLTLHAACPKPKMSREFLFSAYNCTARCELVAAPGWQRLQDSPCSSRQVPVCIPSPGACPAHGSGASSQRKSNRRSSPPTGREKPLCPSHCHQEHIVSINNPHLSPRHSRVRVST